MNPREYLAMFEVEDRHWWYRGVRCDVANAMARFAPPAGGSGRLLDAGCGTGGLLAGLRESHARTETGIDISMEGLSLARSRGLRRLVRGSVSRLPFASGAFDVITSIDVLAHREVDEREALSEFRRCLKEDAVLILQLPAFDWLRGGHDDAVWTKRRLHKTEVERLLREAGLSLRRSFYRNSFLFPAAALRRLLSRRPASHEARSDVGPVPPFWNLLLGGILLLESAARGRGFRLPFGLSVFCVAGKRK